MTGLTWASRRVAARVSIEGFVRAAPLAVRDVSYAAATLLALVWAYLFIDWGFANGVIGFDFEGTLWDAAIAVRGGESPYPDPRTAEVAVGNPALYPPLLIVLVAPLTAVPWWVGVAVWSALLVASVVGALYVLGVRDPRCYALALISAPAINGFVWGNATLLLLPLVALAWRWREHWLRAGVVVGIAIAAKIFLWPLAFWLLGSRRYRAAAAASAAALLSILVPWTAIGLDGLHSYPALLGVAKHVYATHSYSVATMLAALGASVDIAAWGALVAGLTGAGLAFLAARRLSEEASISVAVLAAILGTPIVWENYYVLLLAPLAIVRPRFSLPWVLTALFYWMHRLPRPKLLETDLDPGGVACCKPADVPLASWVFNHAPPGLWPALGYALLAVLIAMVIMWGSRQSARRSEACR